MIEAQILGASFKTRAVMTSLLATGSSARDLVTRTALLEAHGYLARDADAQHVDVDILRSLCAVKLAPNQMQAFEALVAKAQTHNSLPNVVELSASVARHQWADKLVEELGKTNRNWDKIHTLVQDKPRQGTKLEHLSFDQYEEALVNQRRIYTGIPNLDAKLGPGLLAGHTVLVFARPEVGKSLISINLAKGFASQGLRGIFFENEDPVADTRERMLCCLAGVSRQNLRSLSAPMRRRADELAELITVHPLYPGSLQEIEALSEGYDWIVVNQMHNLSYRDANKVVALEEIAKGIRGIAGRNNLLAVSVTQAGDSAAGKRVLDLGDVSWSNTGIPSQMDVMIGVGADEELLKMNARCLSFPKNKVGGDHGSCLIKVDPTKSLVL